MDKNVCSKRLNCPYSIKLCVHDIICTVIAGDGHVVGDRAPAIVYYPLAKVAGE